MPLQHLWESRCVSCFFGSKYVDLASMLIGRPRASLSVSIVYLHVGASDFAHLPSLFLHQGLLQFARHILTQACRQALEASASLSG